MYRSAAKRRGAVRFSLSFFFCFFLYLSCGVSSLCRCTYATNRHADLYVSLTLAVSFYTCTYTPTGMQTRAMLQHDDVKGPVPEPVRPSLKLALASPRKVADVLVLESDEVQHAMLTSIGGLLGVLKQDQREEVAASLGYRSYGQAQNAIERSNRLEESRAIKKRFDESRAIKKRKLQASKEPRGRGLAAVEAAKQQSLDEVTKARMVRMEMLKVKAREEADRQGNTIEEKYKAMLIAEQAACSSNYALFVAAYVSGSPWPVQDDSGSGSDTTDEFVCGVVEVKERWWPYERKKAWLLKKTMLMSKIRIVADDLMRHQELANLPYCIAFP